MLKSWTIRDYDAYLKSIEGSSNAHSWPFFQDFKHGNNSYELRDIIVALHYFLTEEAPFLSRTHFTQVKSSELTETKEVLDVFDVWDI